MEENSLIDMLSRSDVWERFYEYKAGLACPKSFLRELREFIDSRSYMSVYEGIIAGKPFPLPVKSVISKSFSQKKRTVYTYPRAENTTLKLLTWLLLRKYDCLFSDNLYSFRPGRTAKDAVRKLARVSAGKYAYKADVSDYFNSIPTQRMTELLSETISDDGRLLDFLCSLLTEKRCVEDGKKIEENKGIMAGTPLSAFYANLYLKDLDALFEERKIAYARYSDDIIVLAGSEDERSEYAEIIKNRLREKGLAVNENKEELFTPEDGWIFLGFRYRNGNIDVAPASVDKLKNKMRRKTRALARWQRRNCLDGEKAAKAFIRIFNRKLFENSSDNDLTWARWYFPVLTQTDGLHEIDLYAQNCIRRLASGKNTKSRYNVRYEDMKAMGYRSLVHEYYECEQ